MQEKPADALDVATEDVGTQMLSKRVLTPEEREEQRLIRRMQMMMNMVMNVIAQDGSLTVDEASHMIADARSATLAMFPGKELAYDLIWKPRFQRLMQDRFRLN